MKSVNKDAITIIDLLETESKNELIAGIYRGLTKSQKQISSRFFYDNHGSDLFEKITGLPEYYPTRTEKEILRDNAGTIVSSFKQLDLMELGSGDCSKISILLDRINSHAIANVTYMPVDISKTAVNKSVHTLRSKYPGLKINAVLADFSKHLDMLPGHSPRLICFFGSTIGNMDRRIADDFLLKLQTKMKAGDSLLLGLDMVKEPEILYQAYNDKEGVTAQFNKNILNVINELTESDFSVSDFEHQARYNYDEMRIEMHLKALTETQINSPFFPYPIKILKGETIHTENSYKFTNRYILNLASRSGLSINNIYNDKKQWFSLVQLYKND